MRYQTIKNTDLKASMICLGTADFGVKDPEQDAHQLMDAYVGLGGNVLDSARVYSEWKPGEKGRSERIIGDWLAHGNRDKVLISTKGGHPLLSSMSVSRLGPKDVRDDIEASLRSLRTDHIDLYYLHRDDPKRTVGEIVDMLESFAVEGLIRYYGCSNWQAARIEAAQAHARAKGCRGFVANQMLWNVACWSMQPIGDPTIVTFSEAMREMHRRTGMAAMPYSSQANGFFTKLDEHHGQPDDKLRHSGYFSDANLRAYALMRELAAAHGLSVTEIVLLYLLEQDIPTFPIVGCHTIDQLRTSLAAADKRLPREAVQRLDAAAKP